MKKIFILCLGIGLLFSYRGFGQVGEQVENVDILNMNNDTIPLPFLGQKNLLIFYADPARPDRTKPSAIISRLIPLRVLKSLLTELSIWLQLLYFPIP